MIDIKISKKVSIGMEINKNNDIISDNFSPRKQAKQILCTSSEEETKTTRECFSFVLYSHFSRPHALLFPASRALRDRKFPDNQDIFY
jgi:hypothetical protein